MRENHVRLFSRLWRINVQVFTLCWSVTDTSMNTRIMVIGQPHVEGSGCFKNQQRTTISSHSMLLRFHRYQYQSGSIMIFHETSLQFLERQTFDFTLRGFPYIKPLVCFEVAMIYLSKYHRTNEYAERILNGCEETSAATESWHFTQSELKLEKPFEKINLSDWHHAATWKNLSYKWLESYVRLVWLDIFWDVKVIFLISTVSLPIWHISSKRFSAFTLVFLNKQKSYCSWATWCERRQVVA